ncbi:MAG: immune inhibitor A [Candidatus Poseidoniaceae archaeon]|nr:immune inhibitor A [Candidatus Poseidoniaceae archaeon]
MRPAFGVPLLVVLLLASSWSYSNEDAIEQWMRENSIVETSNENSPILNLQQDERWLVLIVDFDDSPADSVWGPSQARTILQESAVSYIEQLSGGMSSVEIFVADDVTRASGELVDYGADINGQRDVDVNGQFLPMSLAQEAVESHIDTVNWSQYDLDGDGWIDRLLILHTTKGQEENTGSSDRIWSHYTTFKEPIEISSDLKVGHYTMSSLKTGSSGIGTMLHEMLHQMGALDLYPVHDTFQTHPWKGVGDWDIMASGNWNGGGSWPALPTAASLELIGAQRQQVMDLQWPTSAISPCIGPSIKMTGLSEGGDTLKIQISQSEIIWLEYRTDSGFDTHLPGSGLLVTYQDTSVGDVEQNELNRDPKQPWLSVIEADGRNDMTSGTNSGEADDLFNSGQFGAVGVKIFDHDGVLVPWVATVENNDEMFVNFTAPNCSPSMNIDLQDHGYVILSDDYFVFSATGSEDCLMELDLELSDGNRVIFENAGDAQMSAGTKQFSAIISGTRSPQTQSTLTGSISCGTSYFEINTVILTLGKIPIPSEIVGTIDSNKQQQISIAIDSEGDFSNSFRVEITGPLSRIAETGDEVTLDETSELIVNIDPKGLLSDGMIVNGEIVLVSFSGHRWEYPVKYIAQSDSSEFDQQWRKPSNLLAAAGILAMLWTLLSMRDTIVRRKSVDNIEEADVISDEINNQTHDADNIETNHQEVDSWGRLMD